MISSSSCSTNSLQEIFRSTQVSFRLMSEMIFVCDLMVDIPGPSLLPPVSGSQILEAVGCQFQAVTATNADMEDAAEKFCEELGKTLNPKELLNGLKTAWSQRQRQHGPMS